MQHTVYERKIFNLGGEVVPSIQYELATHILTLDDIGEGATKLWTIEGKRVVSSDWIDGCSNFSGSDCTTPSSSNCQRAVISTSKRKRLCVERNGTSQRNLFSEENKNGKFHHWLHCPFDASETFTVQEFINNNKDHVTQLFPTPGSDNKHVSILAATEVKLYSRKSYLAMAAMHVDGITMRGDFGAVNFVVDRSKSVKIGNLTAEKLKEIKSKDDVDLDKESFVRMIKNEVLLGKSIPDDIFEWILALSNGEPPELLSCHIGLLDDFLGGHILMTLYDRLLDLEKADPKAYNSVILALPQYNGWQIKPKFLRNSYLEQTFNYEDKTGKKTVYKDNVRGLLHLLRNCKRHAAISVELFSCIVGQYFRRIASDFQKAMHKVGCLQKLNLHYILS